MPYPSCLANGTDRGDEFMGSAAQRLQMITGIIQICGLIKPSAAAHKNLVGTDNERVLMVCPTSCALAPARARAQSAAAARSA